MQQFQDLHWAKLIWNCDIPPSKSFFVWRLMHEKVPTEENLMIRGCAIPYMCNFCCRHVESSFHIFFECDYAIKLWSWLAGCLNLVLQFTSMEDMLKLCELNWSTKCKITITAAIINLLNTIWLVGNQARFNNKFISWKSAISLIIASNSLTGNNLNHLALLNFYKCNIDGASCGNLVRASCGGIFRNHNADFAFAFAEPLGVASVYFSEICGAMSAIEIAYSKNWLETDSSLVVSAFKNPTKPVAWSLRNRWDNILFMITQMNYIVTHIYGEDNQVADLIANHGLSLAFSTSWLDPLLLPMTLCLKTK
ncbi:unnamed protein product [Trifolium pratense]|uniref:Uncharacterized protein n=1 Tax=Trifolium pratense TaxID=57577 RepID=A0ACB0LAT7_TRIPR|nr:unnamed protein product [Trifolium pratense]